MKKLLIVLGVIIVLIAIAIYTVIGNLDAIAKNAIEHFGSEVTQTAVSVKKVHIDLTKEGDQQGADRYRSHYR